MKIPAIRGIIDRRILVNYRANASVLARLLPAPFRPKTVGGFGMVGICLIRLRRERPSFLPAWLGSTSENAAHRTAVEWDDADGTTREGVYIRRRDTSSRLSPLVGGRLFPGTFHHARFDVRETADHLEVALRSDDGETSVSVVGDVVPDLPDSSIFPSLGAASTFFRGGSLGYSDTPAPGRFQGLELSCRNWQVEPLEVSSVHSSHFEDRSIFPEGSIAFDCALLMRGIEHDWLGRSDLCCPRTTGTPLAT